MADDEQPKRGRGRPRLNPVGAVRRNVTVQVSLELYESLVEASENSGLSISREMEGRLQSSFDNAAVNQAVEDAIEAARQKFDDEYIEFFNGRDGMTWAKASADLYHKHLTKLAVETGWTGGKDLPDGFAEKLLDRVRDGMGEVVDEWKDRVLLSQMLAKVDRSQIGPFLERMFEANPQLKEKLDGFFARRRARSDETPPEDER